MPNTVPHSTLSEQQPLLSSTNYAGDGTLNNTDPQTTTKEETAAATSTPSLRDVLRGSPNVLRVMLFNALFSISFSIWNVTALQLLIYRIGGNSNTQVGWVSGVLGVANLLAAFGGSIYADKGKRETITRTGCVLGWIASATSITAVYLEHLWMFYLAAVLWGYTVGLTNPIAEALFADSVPSGQRTTIYSYKWSVQTGSYLVGYTMNTILFLCLGNHWSTSVLKGVLYIGLGLHPLAYAVLFTVRDKYAVCEKKEDEPCVKKKEGGVGCPPPAEENSVSTTPTTDKKPTAPPPGKEGTNPDIDWEATTCCGLFKAWMVPFIIAGADVLIGVGSGMTVRYFPLFFVNEYQVSPAVLNAVYICIQLLTAVSSALVSRLAKTCFGRVACAIGVRVGPIGLLFFMAFAPAPATSVALILTVWCFRSGIINSLRGVERAVIMDFVPKPQRAKWNAVESFGSFMWTGSAVVGGYLVDAYGYQYSFGITAIIQLGSVFMMCPAIPLTRSIDTAHLKKKGASSSAL